MNDTPEDVETKTFSSVKLTLEIIYRWPIGKTKILRNSYGQNIPYRLIRVHLNGAGKKFWFLHNEHFGGRGDTCFTTEELLEYEEVCEKK